MSNTLALVLVATLTLLVAWFAVFMLGGRKQTPAEWNRNTYTVRREPIDLSAFTTIGHIRNPGLLQGAEVLMAPIPPKPRVSRLRRLTANTLHRCSNVLDTAAEALHRAAKRIAP